MTYNRGDIVVVKFPSELISRKIGTLSHEILREVDKKLRFLFKLT